jgi:hypothetical protein
MRPQVDLISLERKFAGAPGSPQDMRAAVPRAVILLTYQGGPL